MDVSNFNYEDWVGYGKKMKEFIEKYSFLLHKKGSIINFLQEKYWENNVPKDWREFFEKLKVEEIYTFLKDHRNQDTPKSLQEFISLVEKLTLSIEIEKIKDDEMKKIEDSKGMNQKKIYEIHKLASVIEKTCKFCNTSLILDIGCGKGHLAKVLSSQYGLEVLGIDKDEQLTQKLEKEKKLKENSKLNSITSHLSFDATVEEFTKMCKLEKGGNMLTSLHSCGDLSSIMLKYYVKSDLIHSLINVGCCYHKLTEKNESKNYGFPLSKQFDDVELGSAKNLASLLSEFNIQDESNVIENFKRNSYRSALEWILNLNMKDINPDKCFSVGKIHSKYLESFSDYCFYSKTKMKDQNLLNKDFVDMNEKESKEYFEKFYEKLSPCKNIITEIASFWTLRWILAPIIESLIITDKILYLYENNCTVKLIKLFDQTISPRSFVIISYKQINKQITN